MSPSKKHPDSPYTPQEMKKVLEAALSPANPPNSPLAYKILSAAEDFESGFFSDTSSEYDEDVTYSQDPARVHAHDDTESGLHNTPNENTPLINLRPPHIPVLTPVRPRCTLSPSRDNAGNPEQTFEVEAPFLQAMVGLLERQANILPEHVLTKTDIKKIVRKEMEKAKKESDVGIQRKKRSSSLTVGHVLGIAASIAGWVVLQRAFLRYPDEVVWYLGGALKGGLVGLAGGMAAKTVLWGLDYLTGE